MSQIKFGSFLLCVCVCVLRVDGVWVGVCDVYWSCKDEIVLCQQQCNLQRSVLFANMRLLFGSFPPSTVVQLSKRWLFKKDCF